MANEFFKQIRHYISLAEAFENIDEAPEEWGISYSDIFEESLARNLRVFPDLRDKLAKFVDVKMENPLTARYGKHDRPLTALLAGFWHCHLRDDAVLIYNLKNRCINLVCIVSHAEIEGKHLRKTAKRISQYAD